VSHASCDNNKYHIKINLCTHCVQIWIKITHKWLKYTLTMIILIKFLVTESSWRRGWNIILIPKSPHQEPFLPFSSLRKRKFTRTPYAFSILPFQKRKFTFITLPVTQSPYTFPILLLRYLSSGCYKNGYFFKIVVCYLNSGHYNGMMFLSVSST
jgi:hypothetical protein